MSSCNFLEVCRDVTKTARKIPQSVYLLQGNYKIFDQGKQYIAGYTNDSEGIVSDYPYIVFGDHTRILKFVTEPCFIGADGVKLLKVYNEDFIPQYVYYALLAQPIENQGYSRHFKYLKELNIEIYTKEEQNAIVSELDKIQAALDNKKEQLKKLDELIQSRFYEMFGDPVVNDKGWEVEKLGKLGTLKNGLNYSQNEEGYAIRILSVSDFKERFKLEDVTLLSTISLNQMPSDEMLLKNGDIVFVRSNGNKRLVGRSLLVYPGDEPTSFSGFCIRFRNCCEQIDNVYLVTCLKTESIREKLFGRGANISNLNQTMLQSLVIPRPPLLLQQTYTSYVEKVEQAKAIVNQEIAHLQELLNSRMDFYFRK